jgi:hypothetical protein
VWWWREQFPTGAIILTLAFQPITGHLSELKNDKTEGWNIYRTSDDVSLDSEIVQRAVWKPLFWYIHTCMIFTYHGTCMNPNLSTV